MGDGQKIESLNHIDIVHNKREHIEELSTPFGGTSCERLCFLICGSIK